jgi:UDP:flavonoid glycosyltransferase YjiC (YdhE family)
MRILFVPAAGGVGLGPLTNVLSLAEVAADSGHNVAFMCKGAWEPLIGRLGYPMYAAPLPEKFKGKLPPPYKLSDVLIGLGWADKNFIRESIASEIKAIASFSADVVVSMLQVTAPISATVMHKPSVSIFSWADGPTFTSPLYKKDDSLLGLEKNYNQVFQEYGVSPIQDISELAYMRSELKIAPTIPELQPELVDLPDVHFVGSLLSQSMEQGVLPVEIAELKENASLIFVYLSPGDISPDYWIPTLVETFANSPYQVIVTLAPLGFSPKSLPSSDNVHFYERLPGSTVIANSDLVISHGGANTVMNALCHGIPQLVFPDKYAEREYNGRAVARLGAGLNLPTKEFNAISLLHHVNYVLSDYQFKQNSVSLANIVKNYGGAKEVVRLIETELGRN